MTSKQRAFLRSMANQMNAVFQIGKDGISDNQLISIDEYLEVHELLKISLLESADLTARGASELICERLEAEPVQCIGRKLVIYRESQDNKKIFLP